MAEARKIITDFTGGEVSDRLLARIDTPIYNRTLRVLENFIVHASGGLDFAPGTYFICEAKTNTDPVRLLSFEKSSSEKYVLELSDLACRFYKNKAQLMDGANPLEIITPWAGANLFGIQTAQKENKLYLAHGSYQLQGLKTSGDLGWILINADIDVRLAVAHAVTPFITAYAYSSDIFSKKANPDALPPNTAYGCTFSPDGIYLAVAHNTTPWVTIYKRSGDTFTKLADPGTLPTGIGHGCVFSPDSTYLAVAHDVTPWVTIYKRSGDTFTKLANPGTLPTGVGNACTFSPDGIYLVVGHNTTPFVTIYKRSGDTFTKLANPTTIPTGSVSGCAFSDDNVYLAVSHVTTPFVTIYKRSGDTFTKLTNPSTLPTADGYGCAFSSGTIYLAVLQAASTYLNIYKRSGDTFTKLTDPGTLPTGVPRGCAFSPDDVYLAVAHDVTPWVTIYKRSGDTFTKIANPSTLPTGTGWGCAFLQEGWQGVSWGSNYPRALTFHDQRLILGRDQIIRGSRTGSPQNFLLDSTDAAAGFEYIPASELLEEIIWLKTKDHNIVIGTSHGEWLMTGGDAPITGSNVYMDRVSAHGNAEFSAILANESLLFVQKGGQRLREFMYSQERGGYISPDLTQLADHIGEAGFVDFAWQRSPRSLLWTFSPAGQLETLTLDRNSSIIAWGRHPRDGLVKSIAVVSGDATNPEDTIYLCVQRVIGGVTKQYIEYMKPINRPADEKDYFFVDCGKTFDYSATTDTMEGATKANPVVVSATAHPFVNDEFVRITGVVGMTQLNGNTYMVKNKAANSFELYLTDGVTPLNGTSFGTWSSGGLCEKVVKDLSGLDHLKLKTVAVYADGQALAQEVVSSGGTITIDQYAAKIHVGLPYTGKIWTQRMGGFSQVRVPSGTLLLYKSRGGKIGADVGSLKAIRYASDTLLTGPQEVRIGGRFSKEGSIMIVQDQPFPMTALGIVADMSVGE
jgi:WD40 repeat protein